MRRLVEYHCAGLELQALEMFYSIPFIYCQETLECEPTGRHTGRGQRRYERARAGQSFDFYIILYAEPHKIFARVWYTGSSGVGNYGDIHPAEQFAYQIRTLFAFVMFVIAGQRLVDTEMVEQFQADPRILRRDQIDAFQSFKSSVCYIF